MGEIAFTIVETERFNEHTMGQSAMKPAFAIDKIAYHPGSCGAANYQFHIVPQLSLIHI